MLPVSRIRRIALLGALLASIMPAGAARAADEPLWEAGIGLAGLSMPDYRGSDERRGYLLPFPYVVYRGELIKVDRQGISGRLFASGRVKLDFSADAGVPVKSDKNSARQGMPDLDPTFEIGPLLEVCLWSECQRGERLTLRLPVRAVLATDFKRVDTAGWVANPHLDYENPGLLPRGWNFSAATGPMFATADYHQYYYGVRAALATPGRAAYEARGGYSGWRTLLTTSRRFDRYWVGAFARFDALSGAVFEDSPLMRVRRSFMAGVGVAWILGQAERRVQTGP